ncbi:MAG: hypothetical protein EZS28_018648 [Streblomastix strix]|uniref:Uncharacterized protein n=1 Tax=Streblomastix strix TaxID=222440 RepID=A0A5J4VUK0_9EUKA|nr:MAG: hypothetical protein EZS28_018648 [Streblomastix strix]
MSSQAGDNTRGLQISAEGNTLIFNGQVIAGTCAAVGSVNYSQGNPILWGYKQYWNRWRILQQWNYCILEIPRIIIRSQILSD